MEYGVHIYVVNFKVNLLSENCKMCFEHDLTTKQYYVCILVITKLFLFLYQISPQCTDTTTFFYLKQKTSSVIASTKRFRE